VQAFRTLQFLLPQSVERAGDLQHLRGQPYARGERILNLERLLRLYFLELLLAPLDT